MDAFAFPHIDHVAILRWLSVFSGYKRWERADDPVTYWFHILLHLALVPWMILPARVDE